MKQHVLSTFANVFELHHFRSSRSGLRKKVKAMQGLSGRRITFAAFASFVIASPVLHSEDPNPRANDRRPNVLFISVDDLHPAIGAYGDEVAITPNMDKLADRGRLFTRAYTQQAVCGPSRAATLTGLLPDRTRVRDNRTHFREHLPDTVTLPEHFKHHGYGTYSCGKVFHNHRFEDPQPALQQGPVPPARLRGIVRPRGGAISTAQSVRGFRPRGYTLVYYGAQFRRIRLPGRHRRTADREVLTR